MTIRVLVVDDSQHLRRLMVHALERLRNASCVEASDGAEALKKAHDGPFDLVLTDINMPVLDGLKLVSHLRQDPAHARVPIVVITTESAAGDRERAMRLGASAFLVKPVQAHQVLATVARLIQREEVRSK
jgi:two-component system, chemotaxis family, chemotaxis protein CheY